MGNSQPPNFHIGVNITYWFDPHLLTVSLCKYPDRDEIHDYSKRYKKKQWMKLDNFGQEM